MDYFIIPHPFALIVCPIVVLFSFTGLFYESRVSFPNAFLLACYTMNVVMYGIIFVITLAQLIMGL